MRLTVFFIFLAVCFSIFSCSHSPYNDFQKLHVGDDKERVLDKAGSPLRSHYQDNKNFWTYRFYVDNKMVYKDIVLEGDKVTAIQDSKEVDMKAIEEKEIKIEESIKQDKAAAEAAKITPKKKTDVPETSEQKPSENFEPVESQE